MTRAVRWDWRRRIEWLSPREYAFTLTEEVKDLVYIEIGSVDDGNGALIGGISPIRQCGCDRPDVRFQVAG